VNFIASGFGVVEGDAVAIALIVEAFVPAFLRRFATHAVVDQRNFALRRR
jgi:hypothetical protein